MTELLIFTVSLGTLRAWDDDKWKSSREQAANAHVKPLTSQIGNSTDLNTNIDLGLFGLCIGTSDLYFYGSTVSLSFLT